MILGTLLRLVRLGATARRTGGVTPILAALGAPNWARWTLWTLLTPLWPFGARGQPDLPPVARCLSALGPSYVKFGQVLSTRPDIAGDALAKDLKHLQDRLPPFPTAAARRSVEEALGKPVEQLFHRFEPPVAAASIAQVHPATLADGRRVAVKVLRPDVERAFARDVSVLYFLARTTERLLSKSRRLRPVAVIEHFEGVVTREMDLRLEAAAGSEYGANVAKEEGFRVPEIFWGYTAKRVLTTGWVDGARLDDEAVLAAQQIDRPAMAMRLVRLFLRTALRDGYFHADMHQGNLKLAPDGAIVAYDFGIMGRIDAKTRRTYAEILFSYITRDYRRGAEAHFDAGYVSRAHNADHFAQALRSIGEPIVGQQASEISMARLLQQLLDVTGQFGMETRPELILLQRTMVVVEGVARSLDPNFNMWEAARPEVEAWMRENLGPRGRLRELGDAARTLTRLGPRLPEIAERVVAAAETWAQRSQAEPPPPPPAQSRLGAGIAVGFALGVALSLGAALGYLAAQSGPGALAAFWPL